MFGVEIWGWTEYKELESEKYMNWTLKRERTTLRHMLYLKPKEQSLVREQSSMGKK